MKASFFRASTRGHFNHGWLDTHHTFSFADYYDPTRIHFGALRVINDDVVQGGEGFGSHPHKNMEIISIPLYGDLEHKDSMGNTSVIRAGEVQVMSAGTGVVHSEFNANPDQPLNFFQIWIFPDADDVAPRYQQMKFDFTVPNKLITLVAPNPNDGGLWIHQQAWLSMGTFEQGTPVSYRVKNSAGGVFAMVVEGDFMLGEHALHHRDGVGITDVDVVTLMPASPVARVLLIDVPK